MMKVSIKELEEYKAYYKFDTNFASFARLLQSKWRVKNGYPINLSKRSNYGNFLETEFAIKEKANFLTENIKELVTEQIPLIRSHSGLISEPRIWDNLLSSQPLCFNLFGELHYDKELATKFFRKLFPTKVGKVTEIRFEYSPGRKDPNYLEDRSAFDVFVEYTNGRNKGFIGIEVKYAESLSEESPEKAEATFKDRYKELTQSCNIFKSECIEQLKKPPISQIWRDHLLSIATRPDYDEGFFVFLFPSGNKQCLDGVNDYRQYLVSDDEEKTGFLPRHLEVFINTLDEIVMADWTKELKNRYLGFIY